jgi:hypothetical protein
LVSPHDFREDDQDQQPSEENQQDQPRSAALAVPPNERGRLMAQQRD